MQFNIPRLSDTLLISKLLEIGKGLSSNSWRLELGVESGDPAVLEGDSSAEEPWKTHKLATALYNSSGFATRSAVLRIDGHNAIKITRNAEGFDTMNVSKAEQLGGGLPAQLLFVRIAEVASKAFLGLPFTPLPAVYDAEFSKTVQARDAGLFRLEEMLGRFTGELEKERQKIADVRVKDLEALKSETEAARSKLQEEFQAKEGALIEREEALKRRFSDLDDRDSTHARRELRKEIIKELGRRSESFTLSTGTVSKRTPIAGGLVIAAIISLGFAIWWGVELTRLLSKDGVAWNNTFTFLAIKQALATAGLVSVIWYGVRWSNQWFRDHAAEEFRGKAMLLDIERASWVVESALEWRKKDGKEIPPELLDRLTRGLFQYRDQTPESSTASEVAATLLGSASKLKLKMGENGEMEIDKPGVGRLKKAVTE